MCDSLLKYWTVYGMFNFTETILEIILESSEFLLLLKCIFLLLFVSPLTSGYLFVYGRVIQPFLIKREETIETNISSLVKLLKGTIIQISWNTINAMEMENDLNGQNGDNCGTEAKVLMSSLRNRKGSFHREEDSSFQRRWSMDSNSDIRRGMVNRDLEYFPSSQPQVLQPSRHKIESQNWRRSAYDINYLDRTIAGDEYSRRRTRTSDFKTDESLGMRHDYRDDDTYDTYYRDSLSYRRSMNGGLNYMSYGYDYSHGSGYPYPHQGYRYSSTNSRNISSDYIDYEDHYSQRSKSLRRQRTKSERYHQLY